MVGIPRSSGCQACVRRKIKCDETRPSCRECVRRRLTCPGYPERFRFCNTSTRDIQQPNRRNKYIVSYRRGGESHRPDLHNQHPTFQINTPFSVTIDERVVSNLTTQAFDSQYRAVSCWAVTENFPGFVACFGPRMDVNFLDFLLHPEFEGSHSVFLVWVIRCLSAIHVGQIKNCQATIIKSRQMYQQALVCLRKILSRPIPFSTSLVHSIQTAMLLLIAYELKDGISQTSWLSHAAGIAQIMCLNGPEAYMSGFGRTLFVSSRPFLIGAAFLRGEVCFLERGPWRKMAAEATQSEYKKGIGSRFGDMMEVALAEIVKCPGLIAKAMSANSRPTGRIIEDTSSTEETITEAQNSLTIAKADLSEAFASLRISDHNENYTKELLGPVPSQFGEYLVQGSLNGIQSALDILDHLQRNDLDGLNRKLELPGPSDGKSLDQFALSMGVI
ncbi:hypothetical protein PHISCL_05056 [Aspergillus sclerotialis]|uniref:Zn(2)-C6 fungal-type domain-containing protein n=1 Tax=Aspergillus sclerotialis TaxID=2070753 RepID=A0A3A2ZHA3_9EURO|nr:hypothetical protein PHISCL_05056 [Aspergillus sclerotialis]